MEGTGEEKTEEKGRKKARKKGGKKSEEKEGKREEKGRKSVKKEEKWGKGEYIALRWHHQKIPSNARLRAIASSSSKSGVSTRLRNASSEDSSCALSARSHGYCSCAVEVAVFSVPALSDAYCASEWSSVDACSCALCEHDALCTWGRGLREKMGEGID